MFIDEKKFFQQIEMTQLMKIKNIILLILTILLSLISAQAFAQSTVKIKGYVFNEAGEPLEGANVIVVGTGFGAAADSRGQFKIENLFAGNYILQASYLGYRTEKRKQVIVNKDAITTVNFKLRPKALSLPEVVIEADRYQTLNGASFTTISSEQIRRSNAQSVGELLKNMAGVEIIEQAGGGGKKKISIRGSFANQVLIVLDGVEINDPLTGESDLSQIPLSAVENVKVWKGGASSRFGSGALGGVVEINSKKNPLDEIRINGQSGSYGSFGIQGGISANYKKMNYFFNFEKLTSNGNYPCTYQKLDGTEVKDKRLNADFAAENYSGKINFEFGKHFLQFQANYYHSPRGLPGLVFALTPYARAVTDRQILMGKYGYHFNNWEGQLNFSRYLNETEYEHLPPTDTPLKYRSMPKYHTQYRVLTHSVNFELKRKLFEKQVVFLNGKIKNNHFDDENLLQPNFSLIQPTENQTNSFGFRGEWQLPKFNVLTKFRLTTVLRFDEINMENKNISRRDREFSPQIGLFLSQGENWFFNLRANWGQSFRAPTFADLFYQDFRVCGNPNLLSERSTDFELGCQAGLPILGFLEIGGTYFRNDVTNLITWELGSFANYQPFNTDALLEGWEINSCWNGFNDKIKISLNHLILDALNKSGSRTTHNKRLTYRPEHTTKLSVSFDFEYIFLEYQKRWMGERFVTPSNTVKMPAYAVDDITFIFNSHVKKVKVNLKFSVFNLFDEKYMIVERAPLPGINWRVGIDLVY